jgi:hypothetical protein
MTDPLREMTDPLVAELETEARYHRDRLALFRAGISKSHPASAVRLQKLEQTCVQALKRLRAAEREVLLAAGRGESASRKSITSKRFDSNEDWIKRENGRIPTKGALAAKRASAGLGTSDDDSSLLPELSAPIFFWPKPLS